MVKKLQKVEISSSSTQMKTETLSPSIVRLENNETTVHTPQATPSDVTLQPPTLSTSASSSTTCDEIELCGRRQQMIRFAAQEELKHTG